ncbi:hypothetical protein VTL71DRAFT_3477 [Oculimacula yallundae]|uniref:Uncharacterized protein n=1 Tax=Oculimacula yallundae TaxID=86028 RepID=A0ABR4C8F7_9HELO
MAPYSDYANFLANRKNELNEIPKERYLRFGNHVYVLREVIDVTQLLDELATYGTEGGLSPIFHVHLYCHRLTGTVTENQTLSLRVRDRGCNLKSLHIFTAQLPSFQNLVLTGDPSDYATQLFLYYDVESGPESFWVHDSGNLPSLTHVVRGENACLNRDTCRRHLDIAAAGVAGVQLLKFFTLETVTSVPWSELRPLRPSEFETFGEDVRQLQNLPILLDDLFTSAGEELMAPQPSILSISSKLRFIIACAHEAPNKVGLVTEAYTLLSRLRLPDGFSELTTGKPFDDCFFVPDKVPRTLESVMDVSMNRMLAESRKIESQKEMQSLRELIRLQGGELMKTVGLSLGTTMSKARLDDEALEAAQTAETVIDKMDDLRIYQKEMDSAKLNFEKGLEAYKERQQKKLVWDIIKSVGEVVVSVGIAVYTGGAGAPLTVGAVNGLLKSGEAIKESTRLMIALKTLIKSLIVVAPKLNVALQNHAKFTAVGSDKDKRGTKLVETLKSTATTISSSLLGGQAGERVDYLGLLADWREMDICTDSAFAAIKEEIKDGKIDGFDEYRLAMKKLAIRGETLVVALKDSYEARTKYLVRVAESKAIEAALDEIKNLQQKVINGQASEAIAFMSIRQQLLTELTQRRRVVFNMLHQGILALIYQSNDMKLQKRVFASLSPALTADQLADHWDTFKRATIEAKQQQSKELVVGTAEAFPSSWRDLLTKDFETPFHIPPTLKALDYQHHMRIRKIYAEFVGLKRQDGTTDGIDKLEYIIWLGPLMIDRASPYNNAPNSKGTVVQYYMEPQQLLKSGKDNEMLDQKGDYAKRSVCCMGKVCFRKDIVEAGWNLDSITDVKLNIKYETLTFPS